MQSLWRRRTTTTTPRKRARRERRRRAMHLLTDCVTTRPLASYAEQWVEDANIVDNDNELDWGEAEQWVPVNNTPRDVAHELAALDAADRVHVVDRRRARPHDAPFNAARRLRSQWITDSREHNRLLGMSTINGDDNVVGGRRGGRVDDDDDGETPDVRQLATQFRARQRLRPP